MTKSEIDALIERLEDIAHERGGSDGEAAEYLYKAAAALRAQQEEIERLTQWGAATFEAGFQERQRAERAEAERDALRAGYTECLEDLQDWAAYASAYFQTKHDLAGDIARHTAALAQEKP